jgi:YVTN family beta-propeller protein
VIDTATNTNVAEVEVGQRPVQVGFSPDGKFVYFSLNGENVIGKVDVATRTLVGKVQVGTGPIQVYVTPDNKYVLAANQGTQDTPSTTVSIIDTASFKVVNTLETGQGAHGVVIDPSSRFAYITNIYGNNVAVIDLSSQKVVATIPTGAGPNGISFSSVTPVSTPAAEIQLPMPEHPESDESMEDMPGMEP